MAKRIENAERSEDIFVSLFFASGDWLPNMPGHRR
jgi:hypothetical protein